MIKGKPLPSETREEIRKLYLEGYSAEDVGTILNVHRNTIYHVLRDLQVPMRSKNEKAKRKANYNRNHKRPEPETKASPPCPLPKEVLHLAMTRNGQRRSPLRLPPIGGVHE